MMACLQATLVVFMILCGIVWSEQRYTKCTDPLGMEDGRIEDGAITSSSQASDDKGPENARLNSVHDAWTSGITDYNQYIQVDLRRRHEITGIGTQGRGGSDDYITEYHVLYSDNGRDWMDYVNKLGRTKTFNANTDSTSMVQNTFEQPIVARYIRINPVQWHQYISMRMELFGCIYSSQTVQFGGDSLVRYDVSEHAYAIHSQHDSITLRFRTNEQDGIMMYGQGSQGDYICMQLVKGKLYLTLNLGTTWDSPGETILTAGSLLDDNLWHDVIINRYLSTIYLSVDRVTVDTMSRGEFSYLDLDQFVFFGGVPSFNRPGIKMPRNFRGCLESIVFNGRRVLEAARDKSHRITFSGAVNFNCLRQDSIPVTFMTPESFIKVHGIVRSKSMNVTLNFRTYSEDGLIMYNEVDSGGFIKVFLEKGKVKLGLRLTRENLYNEVIDPYRRTFHDGLWHPLNIYIGTNLITMNIDDVPSTTLRVIDIRPGSEFYLGGGKTRDNDRGFLGCMRYIYVEGRIIHLGQLEEDQITAGVELDRCAIIDRCNPNPCEHGGICYQNWYEFYCICGGNGYSGATCHTSIYPLSCDAAAQELVHQVGTEVPMRIDLDGSGPMAPFPVVCNYFKDGRVETVLNHFNMERTLVTGFQEPGSYREIMLYDADEHQIHDMVNRSLICRQLLTYECRGARLLNSGFGRNINEHFEPYSWWVGRTNQMMANWGGASPGSGKCQCGVTEDCIERDKFCNCDAARLDVWETDSGYITEKQFLPITQIRVGDTGSISDFKQAYYTVGPLICEGDNLFENMVTFRLPDATVDFPTLETGRSFDISFQFKTAIAKGVLMECIGPDNNFVRIKLVGPREIQFLYNAGSSIQVLQVKTPDHMDNLVWHRVLAERNRKEARLTVDDYKPTRISESTATFRDFYLTSDFVVGASVTYEDGFVGVIRGMMVNGFMMDLTQEAKRGLYGISLGEVPKCGSSPCLNNGTCIERYSHYECDCAYTAFRGPICADDIGIDMHQSDMIRYDFPDRGMRTTVTERIRVGFSTVDRKGLLMQVRTSGNDVFSMEIQQNGGLKFRFFYGWDVEEINDKRILANGQHHDVIFYRKNDGATLVYKIDDYEENIFPFNLARSQDTKFNNLQTIYIGRNETMGPGEGFRGCISRMEFDDLFPLKSVFTEPRPANVFININGSMRQSKCHIEPYTHAPEERELREITTQFPDWGDEEHQRARLAGTIVLIVVLIILFILLVLFVVLLCRYISTEKGVYMTQEDKGAQHASTADQAVVRGPTGIPTAAKKKEWFL